MPPIPHQEMGDLLTQFYPYRFLAAESAHHGVLSLWNPHLLLGLPFHADPSSALFYPPNALFFALPANVAWPLTFILRPILAGLFMAFFLQSLGAARAAGLAAGIIFAFSGFMVSWQGWPHSDSALWLPLIFLSINRMRQSPSLLFVAVAALAFAMPFLAGHPEVAFHLVLAGICFAVYRFFWPPIASTGCPDPRMHFFWRFVLAAILAIGLASIQLLPTFEWLHYTRRSLTNSMGTWFLPLRDMVAIFSRDLTRTPNSAGLNFPEGASYVGMFTLLAAAFGLLQRSKRDVIFFGGLLATAMQIIYGWGPAYFFSKVIPVLSGMPNWRLISVADFCLATLAGLGLSALEGWGADRPVSSPKLPWIILLGVSLIGTLGIGALHLRETAGACPWYRNTASSLVLLAIGAVILAVFLQRRMSVRAFSSTALVLVAVDLLSFSYLHMPFYPKSQLYPRSPVFDFLQQRAGRTWRVASTDLVTPGNIEIMYQLHSPAGYAYGLSRNFHLLSAIGGISDYNALLQADRIVSARHRVLDLTGVKYLVTSTVNGSAQSFAEHPTRFQPVFRDGSVVVFENRRVLPRAFLVPAAGVELEHGAEATLLRLTDSTFDPETSVIMNGQPVWPAETPLPEPAPLASSVISVEWGVNTVKMKVGASKSAILVLTDTHYPGWKVLVDGQDQPLLRADYIFRGVALRPNVHAVEFRYRPTTFVVGALLSLLSLAGVLLIAFRALRGFRVRRAVLAPPS